jgi:hypothetical protein
MRALVTRAFAQRASDAAAASRDPCRTRDDLVDHPLQAEALPSSGEKMRATP